MGGNFHGVGDPQKLQHVDPTLSGFIGRDEALRLLEPGSHILLPEVRRPAELGQHLANDLMLFG